MISSSDSTTYIELLQNFPPRPILTHEDFVATQTVIDTLLDRPHLTADEQAYLNLLGTLVYEYEEKQVSIPTLRGIELLKVLIEERNLRQKDLVSIFKTESIVSAVLQGQRRLTVGHIEKLSEFFHISPALFFDAGE
jgi:HTH-type transcriptional regulator/antitoxin HigA